MQFGGRTLIIETASEACSVALFDAGKCIANDHRELGRGHAERLIPMIDALPAKGRADRILTSLGPGSFTGVRIGIAAARALGVAWGVPVLGYPTLALVAVRAWDPAPRPVTVCMNGGHGEWFVQNFDPDNTDGPVRSLTPKAAAETDAKGVIAGNRAKEFAGLLDDDRVALDLLPDAGFAHRLDETRLSLDLSPIYGRAPDAKPQSLQAAKP
ncbi:MAG: tRNA (adenosine(37)-N6)-threonylcarbamoyltransferase complex dimerization subunit type 1 TsaB [Erythrobacter sp.]